MRGLFLALGLLGLVCGLAPTPADAQVVVYERWTIYKQQEVVKRLPPGFHDFVPMPVSALSGPMSGDDTVFCAEWKNAISFGKRIGDGMDPIGAMLNMAAIRGDTSCKPIQGLQITAVAYAVRGDDLGRPIFIVQWRDQRGRTHYSGLPKGW